ncbi:MAG: sensor histidine kinase [Jatrophihabitantaceae bacterium]
MGRAAERSRWAETVRRVAALPELRPATGAVLGAAAMIETLARTLDTSDSGRFVLVLCLLALCTTLPLSVLPPAAAAVTVTVAAVLSLTPFHALTVAGTVAQLSVLFQLGRRRPQLLAVALAVPFLALALSDSRTGEAQVLTVLLASLGPGAALAGIATRARTEATEHSAARQAIAGTLLEHTARGERARIVRELHDVVAHHVSMIAVQAETARLTTSGMPTAGAQRLSAIGDTARTALTEMRRLLGVLREDTADDAADRRPQPGLRQLNELLDEARAASGTATRLIVQGPPDPLDPGVELAAYRIVQEALTNARRHAPGSAVDVEVEYIDDALRLRIRDNGPGPPPAPMLGGHGLLGMHERAVAVGGRLRTGPAAGGGFLVESVLPAKVGVTG